LPVILSFKDKATAALFTGLVVKNLPPSIAQRAFDKLRLLDAAASLDDLRVPPSNRLEKLAGNRKGQWSIRINDQWRVCFRFEAGHAHDVEVADYH
jgi:proteic killer suppression protein